MSIDYISTSDAAIVSEIGNRLKSLRLRRNLRITDLAAQAGVSIDTIKRMEKGQGRLSTLIAVLRPLRALDQLDMFIPTMVLDPISLSEMQGKQRKRASSKK